MAKTGDVIENPVSGERVTFLATAADTGGRLVRAEVTVRGHGFVTGKTEHAHARQTERFELREGHITFLVDGAELRAGPGELVNVPPRHRHAFWNAEDEPATMILEVEPALNFETIMETAFGLARDGKANKNGVPADLLQLAVMTASADAVFGNALQRAMIGVFAFAGRLAGRRERYARYSGPR